MELSLELKSCLQNVEKVIHIYNERLWLYSQCLLKSLAPLSFGSGQLSTLNLLGQEPASVNSRCSGARPSSAVSGMNSKIVPTFTLLSGSQIFALLCQIIENKP